MAEGGVPQFAQLLQELVEGGVEFILVSGVAAVVEGAPISTFDLEILYDTSGDNVQRLAAVLHQLDATYVDPAGRTLRPKAENLSAGHHLFRTRLGRLDALSWIGDDERLCRSRAEVAPT